MTIDSLAVEANSSSLGGKGSMLCLHCSSALFMVSLTSYHYTLRISDHNQNLRMFSVFKNNFFFLVKISIHSACCDKLDIMYPYYHISAGICIHVQIMLMLCYHGMIPRDNYVYNSQILVISSSPHY